MKRFLDYICETAPSSEAASIEKQLSKKFKLRKHTKSQNANIVIVEISDGNRIETQQEIAKYIHGEVDSHPLNVSSIGCVKVGNVKILVKTAGRTGKNSAGVENEHMLVDNCAMQLVKDPAQFDVVLTENMFGDILSDEASMITGSIGMLASASLNETKFGMYEPSGGSAPDIAGQDKANPIATILSAAMMLRYTFDLDKEADAIENAVKQVLVDGFRTCDIVSEGTTLVGCNEMGDKIVERI